MAKKQTPKNQPVTVTTEPGTTETTPETPEISSTIDDNDAGNTLTPERAAVDYGDALMPVTDDTKLVQMIDPARVMQFGITLRQFITKNNLSVKIQGTEYAMTDGWKFAGMNFGIVPQVSEPRRIDSHETLFVIKQKMTMTAKNGKRYETFKPVLVTTKKELFDSFVRDEKKEYQEQIKDLFSFTCECKLISIQTGKQIGSGFAICSNAESAKSDFDMYAVSSMAQTRSIGKAYRNLIGYVMNAANYGTTPAEEMSEQMETEPKPAEKNLDLLTDEQRESIDTKISIILDKLSDTDNENANEWLQVVDATKKQYAKFAPEKANMCIEYLDNIIKQLES